MHEKPFRIILPLNPSTPALWFDTYDAAFSYTIGQIDSDSEDCDDTGNTEEVTREIQIQERDREAEEWILRFKCTWTILPIPKHQKGALAHTGHT